MVPPSPHHTNNAFPLVAKVAAPARLFVALEPPSPLVRALEVVRDRYGRMSALRWEHPHDYHLTLVFIGQVPREQGGVIAQGLAEVASTCAPLELRLARIGYAPPGGVPRMVWAHFLSTEDLASLVARLDALLRSGGITPADHRAGTMFRPHITLARRIPRHSGEEPLRAIRARPLENRAFTFTHLALYETVGRRAVKGPRYRQWKRWRLGG